MVISNKYKKIAILSGGISDEREISKMSASAVHVALKESYITELIDVDNNCLKLISNIDFPARSRWPLDESAPYMKGPGLKL